jgi:hypothetical protein
MPLTLKVEVDKKALMAACFDQPVAMLQMAFKGDALAAKYTALFLISHPPHRLLGTNTGLLNVAFSNWTSPTRCCVK